MKKSALLLETLGLQKFLDNLMQKVQRNHFSVAVKSAVESNVELCINEIRDFEFLLFGSNASKYTKTTYSWGAPITSDFIPIHDDERKIQMEATNKITAYIKLLTDVRYTYDIYEDDPAETNGIITKTGGMTSSLDQIITYLGDISNDIILNTPGDNS